MGHKFAEIAFTDSVRQIQQQLGSRDGYAKLARGPASHHLLGEREIQFLGARDSFYMATVSETGWPYVQHRGGPPGFVRVLDAATLAFADFRGNRQYVSVGNALKNDRVALFFMAYSERKRLKILGRFRSIRHAGDPAFDPTPVPGYEAEIEHSVVIDIEGFDWNCPQHITPRYTAADIEQKMAALVEENRSLRALLNDRQDVDVVD
jgi:predicted pyridoxine 5'-phosphate oxidase superfamily flavin-nucleotide-binding protein